MKKFLPFFNKKKFKHGSLSVILTAVFIVSVIMLNIITGFILDRIDVAIDLSAGKIFSIEDDTVEYLSSLTDKVTITVMSRENEFISITGGDYYNQTNEILKRFAGASPNITLRYMDLMSNPDFASNYDGLVTGSVIIESENTNRHKILDAEDYFSIAYYNLQSGDQISAEEYQMYYSFNMGDLVHIDISTGAESAFLSAILSVTDTNPVYVGIASGYGENQNKQLELLLGKNAYNISNIDLVTSDIDPKTEFIIINAPQSDYTIDTLEKLSQWLDNDGEFGKTLLYIAHDSAETPNTDAFLEEWGIKVERAYIGQTNLEYRASMASNSGMTIQYFNPHDFTAKLNPDYNIFGTLVRHTIQVYEAWQNIETDVILTAFNGAVVVPFEEMSNEEWDINTAEKGTHSVGVISRKYRFEELDEITSNVIAFGGSDIFSEEFLSMRNSNNAEYFINMMNSISGKDEVITITPKSFSIATFQISAAQSNTIGAVFVIALPLLFIVTGVVIWVRRRYR